jgi:hypothetical protein
MVTSRTAPWKRGDMEIREISVFFWASSKEHAVCMYVCTHCQNEKFLLMDPLIFAVFCSPRFPSSRAGESGDGKPRPLTNESIMHKITWQIRLFLWLSIFHWLIFGKFEEICRSLLDDRGRISEHIWSKNLIIFTGLEISPRNALLFHEILIYHHRGPGNPGRGNAFEDGFTFLRLGSGKLRTPSSGSAST